MAQTKTSEPIKTGSNELELIIFRLFSKTADGAPEPHSYGVNVAKVREIIPLPPLTKVPDMPDYAEALTEVRGQVIPIVDLSKLLKFQPVGNLETKPKVIILEMLGTTVGMIVHDVERIRRIKWDQIKSPPDLLQAKHSGRITGVTKLDDNADSLLLILDLENVISEMGGLSSKKAIALEDIKNMGARKLKGTVLIADDSSVARRIMREACESAGLKVIEAFDGKKALDILTDILQKLQNEPITDFIQLVITDVEMPEMDGLTLTAKMKANPRLQILPIIVNTSLSGDENRQKAKSVGADGYLVKFDPAQLLHEVGKFFKD